MTKIILLFIMMIGSVLFSGCMPGNGGGSGFDTVAFVRNPFVMLIIIIITLYFAFKMNKK